MNRKRVGITAVFLLVGLGLFAGPAWAISTLGVDIHGFISQGYLYSDEYNYLAHNSSDGSFEYNEIGLNFSKNLTNRLRLGIQLFSRDLGDISNNKITLDWAYGDYRWQDWLGIRVGKVKLPVGLYNETRDMDMLRTNIVMPQGIYRDLLRETTVAASGGEFYGNVPLGAAGSVDYQLVAGALSADSESGQDKYISYLSGGLATQNGENDYDIAYSGSIRWDTPLRGLLLGYSNFAGKLEAPFVVDDSVPVIGGMALTADYDWLIHIVSAEYTWMNLVLSAEYYWIDRDLDSALVDIDNTGLSYYLAASYRFNRLFTLGAYYSEYYPDKDDKDGDKMAALGLPKNSAWEKDLALTFRFDLNSYWVFKIEGHVMDGTANVLTVDNPDNDFSEDNWYYGAAKMTFSF